MIATAALFFALALTNVNRAPEQQGSVNPSVLAVAALVDVVAYVAFLIAVFIL